MTWVGVFFVRFSYRFLHLHAIPEGGLAERKKDERVGDDQKRRLWRTISRGGRVAAGVWRCLKKKKKNETVHTAPKNPAAAAAVVGTRRKRAHKRPRKCYFCARSLYDLCAIRVYRRGIVMTTF